MRSDDHDIREALQHWPRLYAYAATRTRDPGLAVDLCQEAYLRLLARRSPLSPERSSLPFLLRVVRNLHVSHLRRKPPVPLRERAVLSEVSADPAEVAQRNEAIERLWDQLGELPSEWREILFLREGLELSYREIASLTQRTEGSVKVTLARARLRARSLVQRMKARDLR